MVVAVNTRFLLRDYLEGYGYFLQETFRQIVHRHPEHQFIFIFDRPFDDRFIPGPNVKPVVVGPPARHPLLWRWWYDRQIPAVLKKFKADVFISCDGICSLATRVPQCLVLHDLAFLHYPAFNKRSHVTYFKRRMPKFLEKARSIVTVSEFSKRDIVQHYPVNPGKIDIVYSASKEAFHPIPREQKELTKARFSDRKEYFVYAGAIHPRKNLINLLKAFSIFKKKQGSNLKLLLVGRLAWKYNSFTESLKTYKFREDVVMTGYLGEEDLVQVVGSAYAMVYPSLWEGFGVPVLEAMRAHVPVITSSQSPMEEWAGDSVLTADPSDPAAIAEQMIRLYKDETLRDQLIEKGKLTESRYNWERTAALLWKSILKAKVD